MIKKRARVQIVPLFETIEDLDHSEETMREYLSLALAKKWIASRNNYQEIMLGYSDSNKMVVIYHHVGPSIRLNNN